MTKKPIIMKSLMLLLVLCFLLFACSKRSLLSGASEETAVLLMCDNTDILWSQISPESILKYFDIKEDNAHGAYFKGTCLSDVSLEYANEYSIESTSALFVNPGERREDVNAFLTNVAQSVDRLNEIPAGREHSVLYAPIARQLNELSKRKGRKIAIINSDGYENAEFSVYRNADLQKLYSHPEEVERIFREQVTLGDLSGVTIYWVYQPVDYEDSKLFNAIVISVYKKLFEEAGAKFVVTANI